MGNIKDNDESLLIGESKYNLIKNFFSEFIHGGKYYERESWRLAFGLTVTLVWLYLEMLRLFAILAGRRD